MTIDSIRTWLREWWVTLRYGSRLTKAGRTLRANIRDDVGEYVEVERPGDWPTPTPIHDALALETFAAQLAHLPETEETP